MDNATDEQEKEGREGSYDFASQRFLQAKGGDVADVFRGTELDLLRG